MITDKVLHQYNKALEVIRYEFKTVEFVATHGEVSMTDTGFLYTKVYLDKIADYNYITKDGGKCSIDSEKVITHELFHAYEGKKQVFFEGFGISPEVAAVKSENKLMKEIFSDRID